MKNDQRDCQLLGDLLRAGMLPEAWIAPPEVREWRELVRYRAKLVGLRSGLKAQAHAVLAKLGVQVPMSDLFGVGGRQLLARLCVEDVRFRSAFGQRIESIVVLVEAFDHEIDELTTTIAHLFRDHAGYNGSTGSVRSPRRSWSPRSATSPGSPHPVTWRRGAG